MDIFKRFKTTKVIETIYDDPTIVPQGDEEGSERAKLDPTLKSWDQKLEKCNECCPALDEDGIDCNLYSSKITSQRACFDNKTLHFLLVGLDHLNLAVAQEGIGKIEYEIGLE
ncbi:hypothetical protein HPP92_025983 [Vanilla planifolia]|uniref:Uncharacterized protein n=1 Tax=Vanilla planifolia TaxID=51239 RepID=A0A835PHU5_VANPL|nr:hypothetical protein HPP92_025983 [Vanilla planifolia]